MQLGKHSRAEGGAIGETGRCEGDHEEVTIGEEEAGPMREDEGTTGTSTERAGRWGSSDQ